VRTWYQLGDETFMYTIAVGGLAILNKVGRAVLFTILNTA
jgi:hypothetical protein